MVDYLVISSHDCMSKILYLNSSPRAERSHSQNLAEHVLAKLHGEVIRRDLSQDVPFVTGTQIAHMYGFADYASLSGADKIAVDYQNEVVAEALSVDTIVLAVPMWNLGMPASVKAWFDQVIKIGHTWKMDENGAYVGLAQNIKRVIIVGASSGVPAGEGHPWDFLTGHVTALFHFIGAEEVKLFWATGHGDAVIESSLEAAKKQINAYIG